MTPQPTGTRAPDGRLAVRRELDLPVATLWAAITDPERTARWFGPWSGDPASGEFSLRLDAEEGAPQTGARLIALEPRHRLVVETGEGDDVWRLELLVEETAQGSSVTLLQEVADAESAAMIGPGWEYYLDRLVAAETGGDVDAISFEPDYVPGQSEYYRGLYPG